MCCADGVEGRTLQHGWTADNMQMLDRPGARDDGFNDDNSFYARYSGDFGIGRTDGCDEYPG